MFRMFRTFRLFTLAFAAIIVACSALMGSAQEPGGRLLTEADIVTLIAQQSDDRAILSRLEKQHLAFTMDGSTLARLKQANPSPVVLAALGKFMTSEAAVQPKEIAGNGTWEVQNSGVKEYLRDVAFIDDLVGVAVGDKATVIRTTDGGKTWGRAYQAKQGERRDDLNKITFSGPKEGWIISGISNMILHTKDAGATWNLVKLPAPKGRFGLAGTHNCTHAVSGSRYFYLCWGLSGSHLFQTEDAGGTWKVVNDKLTVSAAGLSIPDGKNGVYAARMGIPSSGFLGATSDGGATWQVQKFGNDKLARGNYARVQMVDKDNGWYIPHFGTIHATTDGGKTWTAQALGHIATSDLSALHFLDTQRGHVLCNHYPGDVRRTTDGGKSWKSVGKLSNTGHLSGMSFPSMQNGWVVGDKGYIVHYSEEKVAPLQRMLNAGPAKSAWERQNSGVKDYLRDVAFIDDKVGVAVGDAATVIRTTDGGKTWTRAYEPKQGARRDGLNKILFSGPKEGWIISGIANTILHTNDAGATWIPVKLPNPGGRFDLAGAHNCAHAASGSRYFYMCWGLSGSHLFETDDAGGSWKVVTSKIKVSGAGLSIPDGKHGVYAARIGTPSTGYLGQTSDGGATWQVQKANDGKLGSGNYARVQMVDKDNGWYIPQFGTIHATTDGGKTWTAQELGHISTSDLAALHFLDAQRGHVLCNHYPGEVRRTTDGGKSWKSLGKLSNTGHLSGMSFPSTQHGWVVGEKGYIEHYSEANVAPLQRMLDDKSDAEQTSEPYESATRGAIKVKGETGDYFFMFKDGKQVDMNRLLNSTVPLPPGTYEIDVNFTKRTVKIEVGKTTILVTGTLQVDGAKGRLWAPYQDKERKLRGNNPLVNNPLALFAGSYRVDVIDAGIREYTLTQNAQVVAGRKTVVRE